MKIHQAHHTKEHGWENTPASVEISTADLVLIFGSTAALKQHDLVHPIRETYPEAQIVGCSTAGEICGTAVCDDSLVATAVKFDHSRIESAQVNIKDMPDSLAAGEQLARSLDHEGLVHVFVLSDGLQINGSELVKGLTRQLPKHVRVTGGLSGDGDRFEETLVVANGAAESGTISAIGLYGNRLTVGYGSLGGWDPFGPERLITRSQGNVLYELDGESALTLYKHYLGDHANALPASGLLFPLSLRTESQDCGVVRTILSVSEETQSMTFAGDVPEGSHARLMKANFDRLIGGASGAAQTSFSAMGDADPELAILISCVGRKMVLKQRIEEEVESVRDVLGDQTFMTGFYSYGEISPFSSAGSCELHNQTMTITTLSEK